MTDTVGFISNLPHSLIEAFKSTLDEARMADLQLIVIDASDPNAEQQYNTVLKVLEEINKACSAEDNSCSNRLIILNKWDDVLDNALDTAALDVLFPEAIKVSAKTRFGFEELSDRISEKLLGAEREYEIPAEEAELLRRIRSGGVILKEEWKDASVIIKARITGKTAAMAKPFLTSRRNSNEL